MCGGKAYGPKTANGTLHLVKIFAITRLTYTLSVCFQPTKHFAAGTLPCQAIMVIDYISKHIVS
jgi:hypothetical protein